MDGPITGMCDFNPRSPCGERPWLGRTPSNPSPISIHALLAESDLRGHLLVPDLLQFQSTLSLRRATPCRRGLRPVPGHFNPRSPCGERLGWCNRPIWAKNFNPRSPCGERPCSLVMLMGWPPYFNPRSPCGERRCVQVGLLYQPIISIHALLAESDIGVIRNLETARGFQSTLSLRRATARRPGHYRTRRDFNPRSPCGERLLITPTPMRLSQFQSTLSLRRATSCHRPCGVHLPISIHALLAESDSLAVPVFSSHANFNPRSPCGERLSPVPEDVLQWHISIHALLAESDRRERRTHDGHKHFNPRSPCGERLPSASRAIPRVIFQSTLSLRRATSAHGPVPGPSRISIHALLAESDPREAVPSTGAAISIHALLAESDTRFLG